MGAPVDAPTAIAADDGQKIYANLGYDGGAISVRVRRTPAAACWNAPGPGSSWLAVS
ncbi:hypothetical protein [Paeniglutamicibacter cryotolerans]|uniref:Uncharacterized protein n=1 Tax=Paeniglutamicibacter cryotolerans TaxID=670079 RepID=A0A839QM77_9MICC|nr:hypothetical protein [Paeniglutamicibacter cryotolerans]MBB2995854.1 hypothetical protein [Paeniglutamicibacter cryotolerans]